MKRYHILTGLSVVGFVHMNQHFGWNFAPKSDAELLADMLFLVLLSMAVLATRDSH